MKGFLQVVGSWLIIIAFMALTVNTITASIGAGTEYSIQVSLLRSIAGAVIGIGFIQMSKTGPAAG